MSSGQEHEEEEASLGTWQGLHIVVNTLVALVSSPRSIGAPWQQSK